MKPWTTPPQLAWLEKRAPEWHKLRSAKKTKISDWLATTTADFHETFSVPLPDLPDLREVSIPLYVSVRTVTDSITEN